MRRDQKSFKLPFMVLILEFIKSAYPVWGSKWPKMHLALNQVLF